MQKKIMIRIKAKLQRRNSHI